MDAERARQLLREQLDQVTADAGTERADRAAGDGGEGADTGVMDFGDAGARASESMDADLALGTLRRRQEQLQAALVRVDDGSFGRCRVCGAQIDDERLEIRPETEFCRDHAEGDI
jgi:DnaK suppressor protein